MHINQAAGVPRHRFLVSAGIAAPALWLAPRRLFARDVSPVTAIREAPAAAKITITKLRGIDKWLWLVEAHSQSPK